MMTSILMVALGGAAGSVLRFVTGLWLAFPFGTLAVNIAGSCAIGFLWVWLPARGLTGAQPLAIAGLLGGFTTFSAFSLDTLRLAEDGRLGAAGGYVLASVVLSLGACALGLALARGISG